MILEAEDGTQTVIQDMSENTADMVQSYTITLDEAVKARKVLVEISGRAAGGEFYLASPALSEIELSPPRKMLPLTRKSPLIRS